MNAIPLSKLAKNASRKFHFDKYDKVVFINTGDVLNNEFLHNKLSEKDTLPGQAKKSIKKGDILYSEIRPGNGRYLFVNKYLDNYVVSTKFMVIEANQDLILPEYLFLILTSSDVTEYFKVIAEARSGTFPQITFDAISHYEINTPNKVIQKEIVDYIFSLDQKIQLNTQTNQTLEAIAQAIFKSWFVDFDPVRAKAAALSEGKSEHEANLAAMSVICGKDTSELNDTEYKALWEIADAFPSELVENAEFGEVPKGWGIAPLSTFGEIICGKTPTKSKSEYYGNNIPFIKIPDMHGKVFITQTIDNLSLIGANSQATKYISKGSICVSCIATVGLVSLVSRKSQTNQQINSIVPNNLNFSEYLYLYLSQSEMNKYMKSLASGGSATLNMNTSTFSSIQILKPNNEILDLFHKKSLDIFEKILKNEENNQILAQTRDLLLPKLLSGEIEL